MIFNGLSSLFSLRPIFLMREFILLRKMSGRRKDGRDCPGVGAEGEWRGLIWRIITEDVPAVLATQAEQSRSRFSVIRF